MHTFKELKRSAKESLPDSVKSIRCALVGDTATQFLALALRGEARLRNLSVDLFEAEYNQVELQLLTPSSELFEHNPQFVILFQSTHKLLEHHALMDVEGQKRLAEERVGLIQDILSQPSMQGRKLLCYNYPEIDDAVFGNYASHVESSFLFQTRKLNYELMLLSQRHPELVVVDLASLQSAIGRERMFSPNVYMSTEMVLSIDSLPAIASRTVDAIAACTGSFKKCLILDLDNTMWGGVIGDDGLEGIQLGHGLGIGKAFTEFQQWVKKLRQRGIIICVASKNDDAVAREPFERHPEMVLRLEDIAVFQANWETKVDNIRTIQSILNISFDSMVFLDDNPFERSIVRENIPGITVPELPDDPALYLEYLYSLNLFETASYSTADKDRTKQYQVEAERVSLSRTFTNEDDFLKSLTMESVVSGFTAFNTPRVAQLSQRSNQFNLRTVRYSEADITSFAADNNIIDLAFTLKDKFGDNGLIAVVIMRALDSETLFVDTWFMSCRVLKRGMENFTLNTMVERARMGGYKRIIGEYLPTAKNAMVREHYPSLGFDAVEGEDGKYILDVTNYQPRHCHIAAITAYENT